MSNLFTISWRNVLGAVVSSIIVAILTYLASVTDIYNLDFHQILNIAFVTGISSLLKAFFTDSSGKFAGVLPVK